MQFNLIGAGRLGRSIAYALVNSGQAALNAVYNLHSKKAELFTDRIGFGRVITRLQDLPPVDITLITTPDSEIVKIAKQIAHSPGLKPKSVVLHCSGFLCADALQSLREKGCFVASLHPFRAFTEDSWLKNPFVQCDCTVEGDQEALEVIQRIFQPLEVNLIPIKAEKKGAYHAAAVIASNYLITLAVSANELMQEAGINPALGQQMITRLMKSNLSNLENSDPPAHALTGPLSRGDISTITNHLHSLSHYPLIDTLYRACALATLPITQLTRSVQLKLKNLLINPCS